MTKPKKPASRRPRKKRRGSQPKQVQESRSEKLTAKQERFAQRVASGSRQTEAYRAVYNAKRMSQPTVEVEASRLAGNPKVSLRIQALLAVAAEAAVCTKEQHLTMLAELRDESRSKGDIGEAIKAEVKRGEAAGHYPQRVNGTIRHSGTVEHEHRAGTESVHDTDRWLAEVLGAGEAPASAPALPH